jgi:hypothetical protein
MLNIKNSNVFVVVHNATASLVAYNLPPYRSTYWTENKISSSIMPWLPYLSMCTYQQSFIIINDLVMPEEC